MVQQHYFEDEYGVLYSEDGTTLMGYNPAIFRSTSYRIRDGVMKIAANAFHQCQILKSVYMPDSVIEEEGSVFEGCKNLEEARLSANLKNPNIAMFGGCSSLRSVELPEGMESIGENMFCNCKALRQLRLPSTIQVMCSDTFCGSGIEEVSLPEGLTSIGYDAFVGCYNLKGLTIPSTVEEIGPWVVQGHKEFEGVTCYSRRYRVENDALISKSDNSLLACWSKLQEYHIPPSVKNIRSVCNDQIETLYIDCPIEEIGCEPFISCPSLKSVIHG